MRSYVPELDVSVNYLTHNVMLNLFTGKQKFRRNIYLKRELVKAVFCGQIRT